MKKSNKTLLKPDDYVKYGPIEIARFGKEIVMRNNMTGEEHQEYINELAAQYLDTKERVNQLVNQIRELVSNSSPLTLLNFSYWNMFMSMLNKTSEFQYDVDDIIAIRMIDYLQSVIVSTEQKNSRDDKDEMEKWNTVYEKVSELYSTLNHYHMCHSAYLKTTDPEYDEDYDLLYVQAQELRTYVRGHRYATFEYDHHYDLLLPHEDIFQELFGISIEEFLKGIVKMQMSLMSGIDNTIQDLFYMMDRTTHVSQDHKDNPSEESIEMIDQLFEEMGLKEMRDSFTGRFFGYDLFDVEKVTGLPKAIIQELSWKVGEEARFFSEGDYAGWPLRRLPIEERPFICVEGNIYCFGYYSLFDNLYRVIQRLVTRLKPEYKNIWNEKQKQVSEQLPFELLLKILPNSESHQSIYYQSKTGNKGGKLQWCECDGILEFDGHLIVLEVKGGSFTYTHPTTDFKAYIKSIENLAKKPHEQATRFIETLEKEGKLIICDEEHVPIKELNYSDYRHITLCSVTIDNFNEFAARIDKLTSIGIELGQIPSWSISIDELRVYAEYFESPSMFLHFLEQRIKASTSADLELIDELDHLGLYIEHNHYTRTAEKINMRNTIWHGYREELDNYFSLLIFPSMEGFEKPEQDIPDKIKEIINVLEIQSKKGFTRVASTLLDLDGDSRLEVESKMGALMQRQSEVKRIMPLSIFGEINISFMCNQDGISRFKREEAKEYILATMLKPNDDIRLALYLDYDSNDKLYNLDFEYLTLDDIPPERKYEFIELSEKYAQQRILSFKKQSGIKKIGRNDLCPCGSTLKYKKCCGK